MPRDRKQHSEADQSLRTAYEQLQLRLQTQTAELRAVQESLRRQVEAYQELEKTLQQCLAELHDQKRQHDRELSSSKVKSRGQAERYDLAAATTRDVDEETSHREQLFCERVIECASDGICVCHNTGEYPYVAFTVWNGRMTELTGYTMGEINRLGWYQTMYPDPDVCERAKQRMQAMREGANLVDEEWEIVRADGQTRAMRISTSVVVDEGQCQHVLAVMHDVTERKQVEDALRISEENFRQFFDRIDVCLFVLDQDGCVQHINGTVTAKLGYEPADLLGKSVLQVHPEDRRDEAARIVVDMISGNATTCPLPLLAKDGQLVPAETRVAKGLWNGREALFGISKDLSALWASEERFAKSFHCNPSPMALTSLTKGAILDVNQAFLDTLGFERAEIIGSETGVLFVDPARRTAALRIIETTGRLRDFEAEVRTKDGQVRYGVFAAEVFQLQDDRVLLTVMHDITERVRAQEELDQMTERFLRATTAANVGIWEHDIHSNRLVWSDAMFRLYGMAPEDFCGTLEAWRSGTHPEDLPRVQAEVESSLGGREALDTEFRVVWPDESVHWIKAKATVLRDAFGKAYRVLGTNWDITELKQAQEILRLAHDEQLQRHQAELAHVARLSMMGELAASLAHELIQPLHAIKNYAYGATCRLQRSAERDVQDEMVLDQISEEADRAAEIIRRVRRFVEKRAIQFSDICVNDIIRDAVLLARMSLERYRVRIDLDLAVDLPVVVGDPIQIEQVIMNLVLNALEAMDELPDGSRQLSVVTRRRDEHTVQVDVCDSGVGIDDTELERVFEPFFTTKSEGMGMGLAICRSIVHAHGGRLWATKNQSEGCTFHISLPVGEEN